MTMTDDIRATEALQPGDACEWRYPARMEWMPGIIMRNGRSGHWHVRAEDGTTQLALYIEFVRAPGTDPWSGC